MCEQFETFWSTQHPRIEWNVPDFHYNGVNLNNNGPDVFKIVSLKDTSRHSSYKLAGKLDRSSMYQDFDILYIRPRAKQVILYCRSNHLTFYILVWLV